MMEVNKASKALPVGKHPERQNQRQSRDDHGNGDDNRAGDHNPERQGAVQFDGLLAHKLPPEVDLIVAGMSREITALRAEVGRLSGQEKHFQQLAEKHAFLKTINRHEFYRELNLALVSQTQEIQDEATANGAGLMLCYLVNAPMVRQRHGRAALDQVLDHFCKIVASNLQPVQVMGSLGGDDFGIVLLSGGKPAAQKLEAAIGKSLSATPAMVQTSDHRIENITLKVKFGYAAMAPGDSPETLVMKADQDLLRPDSDDIRQ